MTIEVFVGMMWHQQVQGPGAARAPHGPAAGARSAAVSVQRIAPQCSVQRIAAHRSALDFALDLLAGGGPAALHALVCRLPYCTNCARLGYLGTGKL